MESRRNRVGLAMYTVHQSVLQDMEGSFVRLAEMGYKAIEFYGDPSLYSPEGIRGALKASGLSLSGWHTEWSSLQPDTLDKTVDYLLDAGCPLAVVPCLGGKWNIAHTPGEESLEIWKKHIEWLARVSETLERRGLRTGYHNHEHEFELVYDGKRVFDWLFDNLPENIVIEFDSGNCIEGGDDPLRVLKKYKGRKMVLHLKPYSAQAGFNTVLGAGDDLNDWASILNPELAEFEWLLVESENAALPEFENAKLCMQGLGKYI